MPAIIEGPPGPNDPPPARRWLWFAGLSGASAAAVAAVAYLLRSLLA